MLDQIPTEVTKHSKARTDGVSSSDMLGAALRGWLGRLDQLGNAEAVGSGTGEREPYLYSPRDPNVYGHELVYIGIDLGDMNCDFPGESPGILVGGLGEEVGVYELDSQNVRVCAGSTHELGGSRDADFLRRVALEKLLPQLEHVLHV